MSSVSDYSLTHNRNDGVDSKGYVQPLLNGRRRRSISDSSLPPMKSTSANSTVDASSCDTKLGNHKLKNSKLQIPAEGENSTMDGVVFASKKILEPKGLGEWGNRDTNNGSNTNLNNVPNVSEDVYMKE